MRRSLSFLIPGEPQSKQRARTTRNGTYTPKPTREAEARVRASVAREYGDLGPAEAVDAFRLTLTLRRYERRRRDMDNLLKLVMDALNGVVWLDDSQVEELGLTKTIWVATRGEAGTIVTVERLKRPAAPPRK